MRRLGDVGDHEGGGAGEGQGRVQEFLKLEAD